MEDTHLIAVPSDWSAPTSASDTVAEPQNRPPSALLLQRPPSLVALRHETMTKSRARWLGSS